MRPVARQAIRASIRAYRHSRVSKSACRELPFATRGAVIQLCPMTASTPCKSHERERMPRQQQPTDPPSWDAIAANDLVESILAAVACSLWPLREIPRQGNAIAGCHWHENCLFGHAQIEIRLTPLRQWLGVIHRCQSGGGNIARPRTMGAHRPPRRMRGSCSRHDPHRGNALGNQQEWYRKLFDALPVSVVLVSPTGTIFDSNPHAQAAYGYSAEEFKRLCVSDLEINEAAADVQQHCLRVLQQRSDRFLTRHRTRHGRILEVDVMVEVVTRADGSDVFQCIFHDVTEHHRRQRQMELAHLVYQHASQAMLVTDAQNNIIDANPAFTEITGYSLFDILGKNPRIFKSGAHDARFYEDMQRAITTNHFWSGDIWDKKKSGEPHLKRMTIHAICDAQGAITKHIAVFSDATELHQSEGEVWHQAHYDSLTRLPNRTLLQATLESAITQDPGVTHAFSVLMIDLDRFKQVNDTLGHDVGDCVLQLAAHRIANCVTESDMVARYGGDEFMVLLRSGAADAEDARVSRKIIDALEQPMIAMDHAVHISASIGIAVYPRDGEDFVTLAKHADQAMYLSKRTGGGRLEFFARTLQLQTNRRFKLAAGLRNATRDGQMRVHFQPIVCLRTGAVDQFEALLRWQHPQLALLPPEDFIEIAEEHGRMPELTRHVAERAAHFIAECQLHHHAVRVTMNVSPVEIRQLHAADTLLDQILENSPVGSLFGIDIAESALMLISDSVLGKLAGWRERGLRLSIDAFGTGNSSLAYLHRFKFDYLKINRRCISEIPHSRDASRIAETICAIGKSLGAQVIAVGVETDLQLRVLQDLGCDFAQGFLFSEAQPASAFHGRVWPEFATMVVK